MPWDALRGALSLPSLRHLYRSGDVRPDDVVRAVYRRIAARGSDATWITLASQDDALARAQQLAEQASPETLPLYGIPFAVKDNIDVAGLPTTAACAGFARVPAASAPAVAALLEAGAVCIGKTNLDQFATGLCGIRSPYGACASVFNADYAAGGSSSGSALAVAAGLVSFALGTDTGGSGRIPAGFNNVVGVKPTLGRVSLRGVVPNCRTLDTVSIFALSCADSAEVLRLIARYDPEDPFSRVPPAGDRPAAGGDQIQLSKLTFGVPGERDREFFGDTEAAALFDAAIARIGALGAKIVEIDFAPFLEAGRMMFGGPWVAERVAGLAEFLTANRDSLLPVTRSIFDTAARWSAADAFTHAYRLRELKRLIETTIWPEMDLLLVPTAPTAYRIAELEEEPISRNNHLGYYSYFANLLDLCAVAIPNGFLPRCGVAMGITLLAPAWRDEFVVAVASECHPKPHLLRV